MIDIDKYGMTNEELLERFSNLSVDDYKDLLAEVKRLREQLIQAEDWGWVEGGHIFETSQDRLKHYKEYIGDEEE